ncbi:hypothetical protein [Gracilibacillus lacisalsi]|uniref:hypothetical protein n=1 Tax=Gracilibacillus lacisalsi TaxID=393087 RepID=UPI00036947BB|nr:hypothetical protein [Gracilibacillus lacisalsi]
MDLLKEAIVFSFILVLGIMLGTMATKKGRKYTKNIRKLSKHNWFREFTSTYTPLFIQHDAYRSFIANTDVDEVINDEEKQEKFKRDILHLMKDNNL